jgi:hypothetical protein
LLTRRNVLTASSTALVCGANRKTAAAAAPGYLDLVSSHIENLAKHGTDRYGPVKTPMWMASLDLETKSYPESQPIARAGRRVYRDIASPFGSNLYWDQPQLIAAYAAARIRKQPGLRQPVDAYIRSFLERCVDSRGLFEWGNHRYYDAYKDQPAHFAGGAHEIRPVPPAWDLFWQFDPKTTERAIRAVGEGHVIDKDTGFFSRHDSPKGAHAFIEAGGILAETLCWLSARTKDASLADLGLKVARYSYGFRDPKTGLIENNPSVTRWDKYVSTTEVGLWAGSLLRASDLSGRPEFARMAADGVAAYLRHGYDAKEKAYYGQVRVKDGTPVLKEQAVPGPEEYWPGNYADIWNANFPAHDYPMAMADACVTLYQRTKEGLYEEAIHRWAGVVEANPAPQTAKHGRGGYAELFGRAIHFLTRAGAALQQQRYRTMAEGLAADARKILFADGLFRGHAGEDRYDAVDGVGYLLLALIQLETGKEPDLMGFGF